MRRVTKNQEPKIVGLLQGHPERGPPIYRNSQLAAPTDFRLYTGDAAACNRSARPVWGYHKPAVNDTSVSEAVAGCLLPHRRFSCQVQACGIWSVRVKCCDLMMFLQPACHLGLYKRPACFHNMMEFSEIPCKAHDHCAGSVLPQGYL